MNRIRYNEHDENKLLTAIIKYKEAGSQKEVVTRAMQDMPKAKQRPIHSGMASILFRKAMQTHTTGGPQPQVILPPDPPPHWPVHPAPDKPAPPVLSKPTLADAVDGLVARLVEAVQDSLADKLPVIAEQMAQRLADDVAAGVNEKLKAAPVETKKRPRVVVVGLLNGSCQIIEKEFPEIDIRFISNEHSDFTRLKSNASTAEQVFAVVDFLSHKHTDAIKSVRGDLGYKAVRGGMDHLRTALTEFYVSRA